MSWTDERVERLSKLWMEGRSASRIAAELGNGVSRNAVIGKIHRLGLSGRTPPPGSGEIHRERPKVVARPEPRVLGPGEAARGSAAKPFGSPTTVSANEVVIPLANRVTIMDLREAMCRWPLGDPTSAEFRFCGCHAAGGMPYCTAHARVAFQPVADRRRVERVQRVERVERVERVARIA